MSEPRSRQEAVKSLSLSNAKKEYTVDNGKNTMLLVSQELSNSDNQIKGMDKAVELLHGANSVRSFRVLCRKRRWVKLSP